MAAAVDEERMLSFLKPMFGELVGDHYLCIWENKNKSAQFFNDLDAAVEYAAKMSRSKCEVYVGQGLFRQKPDRGRGLAEEVAAIASVWADVDILDSVHATEKSYPPDAETAGGLARIGPHRPTHVVGSGYGLHAYWQFREPWIFDSDEERDSAAMFLRRVGATLQSRARDRGYELDQVHDLARILRIPGTLNWKGEEPRAVELLPIFSTGTLYLQDDLEEWLLDATSSAVRGVSKPFDVDSVYFEMPPVHEPDSHWVRNMAQKMIELDPAFKPLWEMKDRRFGNDASRYELAFANRLVEAQCTDQQIADFNYVWRSEIAKKPPKHFRSMQITIEKARAQHLSECNLADITSGEHYDGEGVPRDAMLDAINRIFFLTGDRRIEHFVKWGDDDAEYGFILSDGDLLKIGGSDVLLSAPLLNRRFIDRFNLMLDDKVKKSWPTVVRQLLQIVEERETNRARRDCHNLYEHIYGFLDTRDPATDPEDVEEAIRRREPCVKDGMLWFSYSELVSWARVSGHEKIAASKFRTWLDDLGGVRRTFSSGPARFRLMGVPYDGYAEWRGE